MIILAGGGGPDKPDPPFSGHLVRPPEEPILHSLTSLPDYDASQRHLEEPNSISSKLRQCGFKKSTLRTVMLALLVYVLLSVAIGVPLAVRRSNTKRSKGVDFSEPPEFQRWTEGGVSTPVPLDTLRDLDNDFRCNVWNIAEMSTSNPLLLATSRFELPATGLVTVRSNVSYDADLLSGFNGSLSVTINNEPNEENIIFLISLLSSRPATRSRTSVCFADTGPNRGLTIYAPIQLEADEKLELAVQMLIPKTTAIDTIITYLPLFTQHWQLQTDVNFKFLGIEGTNNLISCDDLSATQIQVKTVLAPIHGSFKVTKGLSLDTVRGPIVADVTLSQAHGTIQPSFLFMDTGYSSIDAKVVLTNALEPAPAPQYVAEVKTFNGTINLEITDDGGRSQSSANLMLRVQNALAQSNVRLDAKFQGWFNAQTKLDTVTVKSADNTIVKMKENEEEGHPHPPKKPDPPSPGDKTMRTIVYDQRSPNRVSGWIGWGDRGPPHDPRPPGHSRGQVEVTSSLSPIVLDFG